jgi:hypothetical protein
MGNTFSRTRRWRGGWLRMRPNTATALPIQASNWTAGPRWPSPHFSKARDRLQARWKGDREAYELHSCQLGEMKRLPAAMVCSLMTRRSPQAKPQRLKPRHWEPLVGTSGTRALPGNFKLKIVAQEKDAATCQPEAQSLQPKARSPAPDLLKLYVRPKRSHKHRAAIAVVAGIDNILCAWANVNPAPHVCRVIRLQNLFSSVVQFSVAD